MHDFDDDVFGAIFLGGSCDPTTWRQDIAIPALEEAGIAYFNPQIDNYEEVDAAARQKGYANGMADVERTAKDRAEIHLIVIDGQTRAVASMVEAAERLGAGDDIYLVIIDIPDGQVIDGQAVTGRELKDLNRGRQYLREIAENAEASWFETVEVAVADIVSYING